MPQRAPGPQDQPAARPQHVDRLPRGVFDLRARAGPDQFRVDRAEERGLALHLLLRHDLVGLVVQLEDLRALPVLLSIPIGLLSAAILVVNNVRDIDTDRRAGKRTLAVRIGRERSRTLYVGMIAVSYLLLPPALAIGDGSWWGLLGLLSRKLADAR